MEVVFFSEMKFRGRVPRDFPNMRTEFAWMSSLNADHFNYKDTSFIERFYDLGIVINSKNESGKIDLTQYRKCCKKVALMQEGPSWYFQDFSLPDQINYYNNLTSVDIIYVHNERDATYYRGLTDHPDVRVLRSLMIEDGIENITPSEDRTGIMMGGNLTSWYGGFDSYIVARSITEDDIYAPTMGRRSEGEDQLGIKHLPYVEWYRWISELSKRKIGIHLMRTYAAGTFALNCSYLGIPCIGYSGLDTQRLLHPATTVEEGDLKQAKLLIKQLHEDPEFYNRCKTVTEKMYTTLYHESQFKI